MASDEVLEIIQEKFPNDWFMRRDLDEHVSVNKATLGTNLKSLVKFDFLVERISKRHPQWFEYKLK